MIIFYSHFQNTSQVFLSGEFCILIEMLNIKFALLNFNKKISLRFEKKIIHVSLVDS